MKGLLAILMLIITISTSSPVFAGQYDVLIDVEEWLPSDKIDWKAPNAGDPILRTFRGRLLPGTIRHKGIRGVVKAIPDLSINSRLTWFNAIETPSQVLPAGDYLVYSVYRGKKDFFIAKSDGKSDKLLIIITPAK